MSSRSLFRRSTLLAPLFAVALASGCGDDDDATASASASAVASDAGVGSRDEWCAVVTEVDEAFSKVDNSSDEYVVRRAAYESILGQLRDLENGIEFVDESAQDDVKASLAFGASVAAAFVEADDDEAAQALLVPIFTSNASTEPGADWVLTNCGIDIDG